MLDELLKSLQEAKRVKTAKINQVHTYLDENYENLPEAVKLESTHRDEDIFYDNNTMANGYSGFKAINVGQNYFLLISHCQWKTPLLFQDDEEGLRQRAKMADINLKYQRALTMFLKSLPEKIQNEIKEIKEITA